jgi:hypothetical protein
LPPAKTYPDFVQPSDRAVAQFLDIVAARAGGAPAVWQGAVSSVRLVGNDMTFPLNLKTLKPDPVTLQRKGNNNIVIVDQVNQWTVPADAASGNATHASAVLTDKVAYLGAYDGSVAHPYAIYGIDRKTGAVIWTSRVWADDGFTPTAQAGGFGFDKMELQTSGDALVVFGVAAHLVYIERFDLKTGNNLSRFCTDYYGK